MQSKLRTDDQRSIQEVDKLAAMQRDRCRRQGKFLAMVMLLPLLLVVVGLFLTGHTADALAIAVGTAILAAFCCAVGTGNFARTEQRLNRAIAELERKDV